MKKNNSRMEEDSPPLSDSAFCEPDASVTRDGRLAHPSRPSVTDLEDIRSGIDAVVTSDKLDKESALLVTGLFHMMESLMRYECNLRDRKLVELRGALELARVRAELARLTQQTPSTPIEEVGVPPPVRKRTSRWG